MSSPYTPTPTSTLPYHSLSTPPIHPATYALTFPAVIPSCNSAGQPLLHPSPPPLPGTQLAYLGKKSKKINSTCHICEHSGQRSGRNATALMIHCSNVDCVKTYCSRPGCIRKLKQPGITSIQEFYHFQQLLETGRCEWLCCHCRNRSTCPGSGCNWDKNPDYHKRNRNRAASADTKLEPHSDGEVDLPKRARQSSVIQMPSAAAYGATLSSADSPNTGASSNESSNVLESLLQYYRLNSSSANELMRSIAAVNPAASQQQWPGLMPAATELQPTNIGMEAQPAATSTHSAPVEVTSAQAANMPTVNLATGALGLEPPIAHDIVKTEYTFDAPPNSMPHFAYAPQPYATSESMQPYGNTLSHGATSSVMPPDGVNVDPRLVDRLRNVLAMTQYNGDVGYPNNSQFPYSAPYTQQTQAVNTLPPHDPAPAMPLYTSRASIASTSTDTSTSSPQTQSSYLPIGARLMHTGNMNAISQQLQPHILYQQAHSQLAGSTAAVPAASLHVDAADLPPA